jgi:hypothetical protein
LRVSFNRIFLFAPSIQNPIGSSHGISLEIAENSIKRICHSIHLIALHFSIYFVGIIFTYFSKSIEKSIGCMEERSERKRKRRRRRLKI